MAGLVAARLLLEAPAKVQKEAATEDPLAAVVVSLALTDADSDPVTVADSAGNTTTVRRPSSRADGRRLAILKLPSCRLTVSFRFVTADEKCAATGSPTAQWETAFVVFHR